MTASEQRNRNIKRPDKSSHSSDQRERPALGGWLTPKELAKWYIIREKKQLDPKKYDNLYDAKVVQKIREIIHPKVWNYWGKHKVPHGKSQVAGVQPTAPVLSYYNVIKLVMMYQSQCTHSKLFLPL